MKKVLIISMTSGFGHIRAGQALFDYAKENLRHLDVEHVDIINVDESLKKYANLYDVASKKFPFLWRFVYYYVPTSIARSIIGIGSLFNGKLKNYIRGKNPDVIIFTNFVIMPLFAPFLKKMSPHIPIGVVVTDYRGHPYCKFPFIDYYFVPTAEVQTDLEAMGIGKEKIIVTGIPISPKFYVKENIKDLKLKHGISNGVPVVLLITSFAISKKDLLATVSALLALKPNINLVCLASGNEEFYHMLNSNFSGKERFSLIKWTDVMEQYMSISDLVISKAGGLTVSECLALQKPLIMVNPIAGQEEDNVEFMEKNHFGKKVDIISQIPQMAADMLSYPKDSQPAWPVQKNPSEKIFNTFNV